MERENGRHSHIQSIVHKVCNAHGAGVSDVEPGLEVIGLGDPVLYENLAGHF
jgi:hypothetical protein